MSLPLIGITTYRRITPEGYPALGVVEAYIRSVVQAGGLPVLIPLGLPQEHLSALVSRVDGMLFTGGGDIKPQRYGGLDHPRVDGVDPDRDRVEITLLNATKAARKPFLGICRGIQLINVALGGTIYEDISDQHPGAERHDYYPGWPRNHLAHAIQVDETSRLAKIFGNLTVKVNSLHHQGIRRLAAELRAIACAPDGIVEGVEMASYPFGLAVQWHPEWLQEHAPMQALFQAFIEAAGERQT